MYNLSEHLSKHLHNISSSIHTYLGLTQEGGVRGMRVNITFYLFDQYKLDVILVSLFPKDLLSDVLKMAVFWGKWDPLPFYILSTFVNFRNGEIVEGGSIIDLFTSYLDDQAHFTSCLEA